MFAGRTKEGKPYLANSPLPEAVAVLPNFNFNVTHHGGVVAIATEPAAIVGNYKPTPAITWLM